MAGADEDGVVVALTGDEALVLFDWLRRTSDAGGPAPFVDQAEQRALWQLEAGIERSLVSSFRPDYEAILGRARDAIRDDDP